MKSVTVCRGCGRTIENEFIYCPWCGYSRLASDDEASIEAVFNQLEQIQNENKNRHLDEMERQLLELETELNMLVMSAEMHK